MLRHTDSADTNARQPGGGPARPDHNGGGRWPGATAKFALFGEVLYVGMLVSALSLPLVTVPLALAVGTRHLRRFLRAESSGIAAVGGDLKHGLLPSLAVGVGVLISVSVFIVDLAVAHDGAVPFAPLFTVVGWLGLATVAIGVLTAAGRWTPERGWLAALRGCWPSWRRDPVGVGYLLAAIGLVPLLGWQLAPLVVPAIGCLVLAVIAIPERAHATPAADQ